MGTFSNGQIIYCKNEVVSYNECLLKKQVLWELKLNSPLAGSYKQLLKNYFS